MTPKPPAPPKPPSKPPVRPPDNRPPTKPPGKCLSLEALEAAGAAYAAGTPPLPPHVIDQAARLFVAATRTTH